jgi:hypothetical protein
MPYSDYIIYVDESGDHSLTSIDPDYPIFVLTFCIFRKENYAGQIAPAVQRFKFRHFGYDTVVLHEHDIRKRKPPFQCLNRSRETREEFLQELGQIIDDAPMTIIAAVIKKEDLAARYGLPANPYELAMLFCMERAYAFLRDQGQTDRTTHVVFECRGPAEDRDLELEFRRIRDGGNHWGRMDCLEIIFADKKTNSAGLQIADLTARPIGLRVLRPGQPNQTHEIIRRKLRQSPTGNTAGWGFKVFP